MLCEKRHGWLDVAEDAFYTLWESYESFCTNSPRRQPKKANYMGIHQTTKKYYHVIDQRLFNSKNSSLESQYSETVSGRAMVRSGQCQKCFNVLLPYTLLFQGNYLIVGFYHRSFEKWQKHRQNIKIGKLCRVVLWFN